MVGNGDFFWPRAEGLGDNLGPNEHDNSAEKNCGPGWHQGVHNDGETLEGDGIGEKEGDQEEMMIADNAEDSVGHFLFLLVLPQSHDFKLDGLDGHEPHSHARAESTNACEDYNSEGAYLRKRAHSSRTPTPASCGNPNAGY